MGWIITDDLTRMADMDKNSGQSLPAEGRLTSLDFFRGLTMFLLVGEATGLYEHLRAPELTGTLLGAIGWQLEHHPWNGLHFWDLIQPFFMFIVGVAMPFSIGKRWERGDSWSKTFRHALARSGLLLLFGWGLYCIGPGRLTFELWNVLAQLSFTYLVAFLFMRKPARVQIGVTFLLLIATELLYRLWPVAGFNQPFVPDHGFGAWVDLALMRKLSEGHWAAFNCVPTTAHTMWGVLAGQVLKSGRAPLQKIRILAIAGAIGVVCGYALNPWTPIIKRICTSSFVIVSGGWALLALALLGQLLLEGRHLGAAQEDDVRDPIVIGGNAVFHEWLFEQTVQAGRGSHGCCRRNDTRRNARRKPAGLAPALESARDRRRSCGGSESQARKIVITIRMSNT